MFSAIIFLAYTFIKLKWKKKLIKNTIILGAFLFIGGSIINNSLGGSRYLSLLKKLLNEVSLSDLFFLDGSLNQRLEHLVYSMHGAVNNFFIPAGFDAFVHIKDKLDSTYNYYFWSSGLYGEPSNKIKDQIKKIIRLKAKQSFIKSYLSSDVEMIKKLYSSIGYNFSDVKAKINRIDDGLIYLQITRGVAERDFKFPKKIRPSFVMIAKSIPLDSYENSFKKGIKVRTIKD